VIEMTRIARILRRRGSVSGGLLVLLGVWGGLIPFLAPHFHDAHTTDSALTYTVERLWLEILPALGTLAGGIMVLISAFRPIALAGALLAAICGSGFAIGALLAPIWSGGTAPAERTPAGAVLSRVIERIGFFTGLGVATAFVAALALGRLSVARFRDAKVAAGAQAVPVEAAKDPAEQPATSGTAAD
jgi:hypothetical protein